VVALVAVISVVAAGCGGDDDTSSGTDGERTTKVKVAGIAPFSVTAWPLVVADSEGYFADENIEVDKIFTFDGGQLLAGGKVDMLNDGGDSGLIALEQGKDAIAVAPLANRVTDGLLVSDDITEISQLDGKTLRTSGTGATDEFLLKRFLEDKGVDVSSVKLLPVEDDGPALAQLDAGTIDGGLFDQGVLLEAENGGIENARVLAEPAELGVYPWNLLQSTRGYAEANKDVVVGFIRAIQRAIEFIKDPANKEAVVDAVVKADETLDRQGTEDTYDAAKGFSLYATEPLTDADIQPAIDYLKETQDGGISVTAEDFIDNSYLAEAQA
jgi:NitT/TauT family transport system substrate-binding protein